jgi:hypothetical protein
MDSHALQVCRVLPLGYSLVLTLLPCLQLRGGSASAPDLCLGRVMQACVYVDVLHWVPAYHCHHRSARVHADSPAVGGLLSGAAGYILHAAS